MFKNNQFSKYTLQRDFKSMQKCTFWERVSTSLVKDVLITNVPFTLTVSMAEDIPLSLIYVHIIMSVGGTCLEYCLGTSCLCVVLDFLWSSSVLPGEFQNSIFSYFMIISFTDNHSALCYSMQHNFNS